MIMTNAMIPILLCTALAVLQSQFAGGVDPPSTFTQAQFYPSVPEEDASGAIRDIIRRNSRRFHSTLIVYNATDIEFADNDSRIMTPRTRQKLHALSAKVQHRWPNVRLKVLRSWTDHWQYDNPKSLRYEGRASDFVTSDNDLNKLGILAGLAVEVGFDWVKYVYKNNLPPYIHGSVISEVCQTAVDLLFILDGSGSVKKPNFDKAKDFVKNVIDFFDVGNNGTHIAVIQYSTSVEYEFKLSSFYTENDLKQAVDDIDYKEGYTNTPAALDAAREVIFKEQNGARPLYQGIPRIAVLMTDGKSNRGNLTTAVLQIRQTNINVFVIGVGNLDINELNFIASSPQDQHVFLLDSFNDIAGFVDRLSAISCDEPASVNPGDNTTTTVELDDFKYFKSECEAFGNNITIEQHDLLGLVHVYASVDVQNPGPLDPPHLVFRNESNSVIKTITVLLPSNSSTKLVYVSVQGKNDTNMFTLYIWDTLFEQSNYDAYVTENAQRGTFVFTVVADFRSGFNFIYKIISGNFGNAFSIDPKSGDITTNRLLNREARETYVLSILAQDIRLECHRGKTQVTVIVRDVNDNHPMFTRDSYQVTVVEDVSPGHLVTQITATDRDKGVNSVIQYSISHSTGPFRIVLGNGQLRTTGNLDREKEDTYQVTVVAADGGGLTKSVNVSISVLDVNDNKPTFTRTFYSGTVSGTFNASLSSQVATVLATDPDLGKNGIVRYQLAMASRANGSSSNNYTVTVTGHDLGTPQLSRNVLVLVTNWSPCPLLQFSVGAISGVVTANAICRPPVIIQGPDNTTIEAGQTVSLTCIVTGLPSPEITWLFSGAAIPRDFVGNNPSNFSFEVAPLHTGIYQCQAVNEVGQATSPPAFLRVYEPGDLIGVIIQVDTPSDDGSCQVFDQIDFQIALETVLETETVTTATNGDICPQSPCLSNPCNGNGICEDNGDSFTCRCMPGWSGSQCNNDVNECDLGPCVNGGTCSNMEGSFNCSCLAGYGGHSCELVTDACSNNTCTADEDCVPEIGGYRCVPISDELVAIINTDADQPSFIIEEQIEFLLGFSEPRKRRAVGTSLNRQPCNVRVVSEVQLSEGSVQVSFVVLCPDGANVSSRANNSYCERLVHSGLSEECQAGENGLLVAKPDSDPSVSIHLFLIDPETDNTLSASQALALFESKNVLAVLADRFGYNITSVSAVHPNLLAAAQSSGLSGGGIAGIVIAVLVITAAAVVGVVVFLRMRSKKSEDMKSSAPTYPGEVVYDEIEEGNKQKGAEKSQHLPNTSGTMENQYAYAKTPVSHSNSLGVPQRPQRQSQAPLLDRPSPTGSISGDEGNAGNTGHLQDIVIANPMYQYPGEAQPWFHGTIDRREAEARLAACGNHGAFLIRVSSKDDGYSLSVYTPQLSKLYHHILIRSNEQNQLTVVLTDSSSAVYNSLPDIVSHYTQNKLQFGQETIILTTPVSR